MLPASLRRAEPVDQQAARPDGAAPGLVAPRSSRSVGSAGARPIPGPTVARLPVYRRALVVMAERQRRTVSSAELALEVGVNPATLRRDLSHLGSYGTRGTGYEVTRLLARVDRALAIDREWPVVIVGAGNLGRALARSGTFSARGFRVAALVDIDRAVVGDEVGELVVEHLDGLEATMAREGSVIAVLATPAAPAQELADRLVAAGVLAILNLAPVVLQAPPQVRLGTVDLAAELQVLAFYGARTDRGRRPAEARRAVPARPAGRHARPRLAREGGGGKARPGGNTGGAVLDRDGRAGSPS